jgi:hypothetical protein
MLPTNSNLRVTETSWGKLKSLLPVRVDLGLVERIRECDRAWLADARNLESLILELGLSGEGLEEYPPHLHARCGEGLRIWQYPSQFSRYLADLAQLGVASYLEVGVRHGGTFIATVEVLGRFRPIERAVAVDLLPWPSYADYRRMNDRVEFARIDTQSTDWPRFLAGVGSVDLALIDAFHDETQCRREFESLRHRARIIALHDIVHHEFDGVRKVWGEIVASGEFECREYVDQYDLGASYMGIGLAIRRTA